MRSLLLAGAAMCCAVPSLAGVITVGVTDNGIGIPIACVGGANGPIDCQGGDAAFSAIHVAAVGVPDLQGAALSTITLSATSALGGTHVLGVTVTQGGLLVTGLTQATSTFTVNNLVGGPFGPTTETTFVNGSQLATVTFGSVLTDSASSTDVVPGMIVSDAHVYAITFTGPDQTATDTIQLATAAPEPMSLALLGVGLLGLTLVRGRRA